MYNSLVINDSYFNISTKQQKQEFTSNFYNKYLLSNKEELLKRDIDKNYISWFQFGRSQGVQTTINHKLVVDPIVNTNGKVICMPAEKETVVYSGIFITGENLNEIKEILSSENFVKYVEIYGKDMQNGYKSLTTKIIKNYINN